MAESEFDSGRGYEGAATPKSPVLLYQMVTPDFADIGNEGGIRHGDFFVPGEHPTLQNVSFVSFELTDAWGEFESCEMTFEDPDYELADCPALIEGRTRLIVSFGYADMLSPVRTLIYYRNEMDFSESGRVTTKLSFMSVGIELGLVRQARVVTAQMVGKPAGTEITLTDVARLLAKDYGLTPVIDPDVELFKRPSYTIPGQTPLAWLNDMLWSSRPKNLPTSAGYMAQIRNGELRVTAELYDKDIEHLFVYRGKDSPLRTFRPSFAADLQRGGLVLADQSGFSRTTGERMDLKNGQASGASVHDTPNVDGKQVEHSTTDDTYKKLLTTKSPDMAIIEAREQRVKIRSLIDQRIVEKRKEITAIDQTLVDKTDGITPTTDPAVGTPTSQEWRARQKLRLQKELDDLLSQQSGAATADALVTGATTTPGTSPGMVALGRKYGAHRITPQMDQYFKEAQVSVGPEPALLKALASHESGFTNAWGQVASQRTGARASADYGIMQINSFYAPTTNLSYYKYDIVNSTYNVVVPGAGLAVQSDKYYADNKLLGKDDWPNLRLNQRMNIFLGASIFQDKYVAMRAVYKNSVPPETLLLYAISAYNTGTRPGGFVKLKADGVTFENQAYVDAIIARYSYFKGIDTSATTNSFVSDPTVEHSYAIRDNTMESMIQKTMTASMELWGFPLINTGQPIGITAVPARYTGKWFVFRTVHKVGRATGFTTTCDLKRSPPGTDEKNIGPLDNGKRSEPQKQTNVRTGDVTTITVTPKSGVSDTPQTPQRNINGPTYLPANSTVSNPRP